MKNFVKTLSNKVTNLMQSTKAKAMAATATAVTAVETTYCVDLKSILNKTIDLVFTLTTWGGIIITVMGVIMVGKAVMDTAGNQAQPGSLMKALGVAILGAIMLSAKSVLTILGVTATI